MPNFDFTQNIRLEVDAPTTGQQNLIKNPNGEKGAWFWTTPFAGTAMSSTGITLRYIVTGTSSNNVFYSGYMPIAAGQFAAAQVNVASITANHRLVMAFQYADANKSYIAGGGTSGGVTSGTGIAHVRDTFAAPAGSKYVRVQVLMYKGTTGSVVPDLNAEVYFQSAMAVVENAAVTVPMTYKSPTNWVNLFNSSTEISFSREALDLGEIEVSVRDSSLNPMVQNLLENGKGIRMQTQFLGAFNTVFDGTITDYSTTYDNGITIDISGIDGANRLASQRQSRGYANIGDLPFILESAEFPWRINGSTAHINYMPDVKWTIPEATVLDQIAITRDSKHAIAYVSRDGILTATTTLDAPFITLTDVASEIAGNAFSLGYLPDFSIGESAERVINTVNVTYLRYNQRTKNTTEIKYGPFVNAESVRKYGPRDATFTVGGMTETAVETFAQEVLSTNKQTIKMPESVTIPIRTTANLSATYIELFQQVNFKYKTFTGTFVVTSIEHEVTPDAYFVTLGFGDPSAVASPTVKPTANPNYPEDTPYSYRWRTGAQSVPNGTWTAVAYNDSEENTGTTYASNRYTIGRAGRYDVRATVGWAAKASGTFSNVGLRSIRLLRNNTVAVAMDRQSGAFSDDASVSVNKVLKLDTGDTLEIQGHQDSGGALNIVGGRPNTNITLTWIGD